MKFFTNFKRMAYPAKKILLEPGRRNIAPAITLAALEALTEFDDAVLVITPTDHEVLDGFEFGEACLRAVEIAQTGSMALVENDRVETELG